VLSDVVMPGRTGLDLLRAVRSASRPVPVVLMTGYSQIEPGADLDAPIVRKPFRQADLLATLELVVRPRSNA
jgi:CheY-like chemotaxis protein